MENFKELLELDLELPDDPHQLFEKAKSLSSWLYNVNDYIGFFKGESDYWDNIADRIFDMNICEIINDKYGFDVKKSISRTKIVDFNGEKLNYYDCKNKSIEFRKNLSKMYGKQQSIQNKLDLVRSYLSYRKVEREKDFF